MHYRMGFDERERALLYEVQGESVAVINVAFLLGEPLDESHATLIKIMQRIEEEKGAVSLSHESLYKEIRASLLRGCRLSYGEYQSILAFLIQYLKFFINYDIKDECRFGSIAETIGEDSQKWPNGLFVRYGNVELRVIDNWLFRHDELFEQEREIVRQMHSETYMYARPSLRKHWLSSSDIEFNLRALMTNAGYYAANVDDGSLEAWCSAYYVAMKNATALFPYQGAYPFFFAIQNSLLYESGMVDYVSFPNTHRFYSMLTEESVLFVTPFAKQINELHSSGRIYRLYKDIRIPKFELLAIPSYLSTYPNRPHGSWLETFETLKRQIDAAFQRQRVTLFFAASGCYGLPLADYVYSTYGCTSVYFGNHINTLFGISQGGNTGFREGKKNTENWAKSHLGSVPNMGRIDGGRYV